MTTHQYKNLTGNEVFTVGDTIAGMETGYPHLDDLGDVGWIADKKTGAQIARYIAIRLYHDPVTNEVLTKDVQIVEALNPKKVLSNTGAKCAMHNSAFPCKECKKLEQSNYGWAGR